MMDNRSLRGRRAVVTGAGSGIGRAIALQLARADVNLHLLDRDDAKLARTLALLPPGAVARTRVVDVADEAACHQAVAEAAREGPVDTLVNAAGMFLAGGFLDLRVADFERLMRVNLHGAIHFMQAALPSMREHGFGRIVNIGSTAGKWGTAYQSAYNVSKHALIGLTRCIALEFAGSGVTVNSICPGPVRTPMLAGLIEDRARLAGSTTQDAMDAMLARVPTGRLIEVEEVAALSVYLVSVPAAAITGQSLVIDGGMLQI